MKGDGCKPRMSKEDKRKIKSEKDTKAGATVLKKEKKDEYEDDPIGKTIKERTVKGGSIVSVVKTPDNIKIPEYTPLKLVG